MSIEDDLLHLYPNLVKTEIIVNECGNKNISRTIYSDNGTLALSTHKYLEKIVFNQTSKQKEIIVVGGNPAICDNLIIDKTNVNIINYLKSEGYTGYYLVNLCSNIAKGYSALPKTVNNMEKFIADSIKNYGFNVCIMWGTSKIPTSIKPSKSQNLLYSVVSQNSYCTVGKNGNACHGAYSVGIEKCSSVVNVNKLWKK